MNRVCARDKLGPARQRVTNTSGVQISRPVQWVELVEVQRRRHRIRICKKKQKCKHMASTYYHRCISKRRVPGEASSESMHSRSAHASKNRKTTGIRYTPYISKHVRTYDMKGSKTEKESKTCVYTFRTRFIRDLFFTRLVTTIS